MNEALHALFDQVQAEEELKEHTLSFLRERTRGYGARRAGRGALLAAAACAAVMLLAGGRWLYFTPTAEISIDINPSIELAVNRFDKVVSVCGRNDDGQALAADLDVMYLDCTEAMVRILDSETVSALLAEDGALSIGVIGQEGDQATRLLEELQSCAQGHGGDAYCYFAHHQEVEPAHGLGLSYGKYKALLDAQALDPSMTAQQIQDMTMREIRDWMACHEGSCGTTGQQTHAADCVQGEDCDAAQGQSCAQGEDCGAVQSQDYAAAQGQLQGTGGNAAQSQGGGAQTHHPESGMHGGESGHHSEQHH